MPSTRELVESAKAGEHTAYCRLVQMYERAAVLTAYAVVHDFHTAQDVTQDAFLNAYTKLHQLRDAASLVPGFCRSCDDSPPEAPDRASSLANGFRV